MDACIIVMSAMLAGLLLVLAACGIDYIWSSIYPFGFTRHRATARMYKPLRKQYKAEYKQRRKEQNRQLREEYKKQIRKCWGKCESEYLNRRG